MKREEFDAYFAAFNARRYDEFIRWYSDDVEYVMDGMRGKVFHGPAAIASLYRELHQYFDEEVVIGKIALTDDFIAVEVPTLLHCRKDFDLPGFVPIPAGQTCRMTCFNHYDLAANGKIRRIRVAIQSMDYLPSKN